MNAELQLTNGIEGLLIEMTEHNISWYESMDGMIFQDEMECCEHELNILYNKSGVGFFINGELVEYINTKNDKTYNEITDIYIDRSKEKQNQEFYEYLHLNYGWCEVEEVLEGNEEHYHFFE